MNRRPDRTARPVVHRVRVRYAKRGRLRFASHRDFQRALERALRRAQVPIAYSAGFSPHPKVSYANAAPTGVASEAEYLELGLARQVDPQRLAATLDAALPPGLDIVEAVTARTADLAGRLEGSVWQARLPGLSSADVASAVAGFLAADEVQVERLTKAGMRSMDARGPVLHADVTSDLTDPPCAILTLVVRHVTPSVRPDDVLAALRRVADLAPPVPPQVTRLAQGPLDADDSGVGDPLAPDRLPATGTG